MPQLSTGFVIAGAYADKLRRVLFAQLRTELKRGEIEGKKIAQRAGELNRLLFEILVNRLHIDKGDVVRIRVEYDIKDNDIQWKLNTLRIEVFKRVPDEQLVQTIRETIRESEKILARPVSEEEIAWTEKVTEKEVEREIKRRIEEAETKIKGEEFNIAEAIFYGETVSGEKIALVKNTEGENIGLIVARKADNYTEATIVLVPSKGEAYKTTITLPVAISEIEKAKDEIVNTAANSYYTPIARSEAENIIREKLKQLR
ncbi:MAG: hypothetical protein DSY37_04740 [Hyperthermus sp.]|nr:MAG: hypothetical protein DSY37_04740 [Hyperthermus sp.]